MLISFRYDPIFGILNDINDSPKNSSSFLGFRDFVYRQLAKSLAENTVMAPKNYRTNTCIPVKLLLGLSSQRICYTSNNPPKASNTVPEKLSSLN